ncbi:MAG: RNA polymerase sigma factor [Planctomycetes bacterium]|nr:RNA polymerase sigma factor [Planctomycetota bacterium]
MHDPLYELDDDRLVERIDRGDARAFEVLYHRHRERLFAIAWRFTRDAEDAADVLQEAFSYFLGRFPGFRLHSRLVTFLYPVLRHLARDLRARRARRGTVPLDDVEVPLPAPDPPGSTRGELARVLGSLPDAQREVVLLRFVDELTLDEIATALAIPVGTVKSRMHQALQTLRADPAIRRYFGGGGAV